MHMITRASVIINHHIRTSPGQSYQKRAGYAQRDIASTLTVLSLGTKIPSEKG